MRARSSRSHLFNKLRYSCSYIHYLRIKPFYMPGMEFFMPKIDLRQTISSITFYPVSLLFCDPEYGIDKLSPAYHLRCILDTETTDIRYRRSRHVHLSRYRNNR